MQIQAGGNSTTVKNCTLDDIDEVCFSSKQLKLATLSQGQESVAAYARDRYGDTGVVGGPLQDWINNSLEQSPHQLPAAAITYLRTKMTR